LYATCKPDTEVPRASYEAVAHVYAVVHEMMALDVPPGQREAELESRGEPPPSARGEMS
jgi:type III secretion protein U